jgi:hypothetical protein
MADVHKALLSHFSLLAEFLILKVLVKDRDSRVLKLVNLNPELLGDTISSHLDVAKVNC